MRHQSAVLAVASFAGIVMGVVASAPVLAADGIFATGFDDNWQAGQQNLQVAVPGVPALTGRLYLPDLAHRNGAAIVAMHGCSGLWSYGQPGTIAQVAIEKWGRHLASEGYVVLAVDSFTSRTPPDAEGAFQNQCRGTTWAGAVDPYTVRVGDFDTARNWLSYRLGTFAASKVGALGWSQGAESVLVRAAETHRDLNESLYSPAATAEPVPVSVAFYPGCGPDLGFRAASGVTSSFWRSHADIRINHAAADPLEPDCETRAAIAASDYGALPGSARWVDFVSYADAAHSFDGKVSDWPQEGCVAGDSPDVCASKDADLQSMQFFDERLRQ